MSRPSVERIAGILESAGEADDALRQVVAALTEDPGIAWAGIAFLDDGELVLGPAAGVPHECRETTVPIAYEGERIGELRVHGEADLPLLERVAGLVSPFVLIGWDTGGETWDP